MPRLLIKRKSVSGSVPAPADLQEGELALNTADSKLFILSPDGSSVIQIAGSGYGPAGADNQIQYNAGSIFGASPDFVFDPTTEYMRIGSNVDYAGTARLGINTDPQYPLSVMGNYNDVYGAYITNNNVQGVQVTEQYGAYAESIGEGVVGQNYGLSAYAENGTENYAVYAEVWDNVNTSAQNYGVYGKASAIAGDNTSLVVGVYGYAFSGPMDPLDKPLYGVWGYVAPGVADAIGVGVCGQVPDNQPDNLQAGYFSGPVAISRFTTASSTVETGLQITGNISQTGTAGYTLLDLLASETTFGSGPNYLITARQTDTQIPGTPAIVFSVDRLGLVQATAFYGDGYNITDLNASNLSSGTVPTDVLGSGTADDTTFLRGDNTWQPTSSFSGAPGGADTQVQFNSTGTFAGSANFTWNDSTSTLALNLGTLSDSDGTGTNRALTIEGTWADAYSSTNSFVAPLLIDIANPQGAYGNLLSLQANNQVMFRVDIQGVVECYNSIRLLGSGALGEGSVVASQPGQYIRSWATTVNCSQGDPANGPDLSAQNTDNGMVLAANDTDPGPYLIMLASGLVTTRGSTNQGTTDFFEVQDSTGAIHFSVSPIGAVSRNIASTGVISGNGAGLINLNASNLATGIVSPVVLGSGTADTTTFLRGDNTWAVPSGAGSGLPPGGNAGDALIKNSSTDGDASWGPIDSINGGTF